MADSSIEQSEGSPQSLTVEAVNHSLLYQIVRQVFQSREFRSIGMSVTGFLNQPALMAEESRLNIDPRDIFPSKAGYEFLSYLHPGPAVMADNDGFYTQEQAWNVIEGLQAIYGGNRVLLTAQSKGLNEIQVYVGNMDGVCKA